jgi:hypothetical protein
MSIGKSTTQACFAFLGAIVLISATSGCATLSEHNPFRSDDTTGSYTSSAARMLANATKLANQGDMAGALKIAKRVSTFPTSQGSSADDSEPLARVRLRDGFDNGSRSASTQNRDRQAIPQKFQNTDSIQSVELYDDLRNENPAVVRALRRNQAESRSSGPAIFGRPSSFGLEQGSIVSTEQPDALGSSAIARNHQDWPDSGHTSLQAPDPRNTTYRTGLGKKNPWNEERGSYAVETQRQDDRLNVGTVPPVLAAARSSEVDLESPNLPSIMPTNNAPLVVANPVQLDGIQDFGNSVNGPTQGTPNGNSIGRPFNAPNAFAARQPVVENIQNPSQLAAFHNSPDTMSQFDYSGHAVSANNSVPNPKLQAPITESNRLVQTNPRFAAVPPNSELPIPNAARESSRNANELIQVLIDSIVRDLERLDPAASTAQRHEFIRQHVHLRLLQLIAGQPERALSPIPIQAAADQEFWQQVFWAISNYFDSEQMPDPSDRATETIAQLRSAIQWLQKNAKLKLSNMTFCHKISSYGNYKRFSRDEFSPGQSVLIYAEIENFTSVPTSDSRFRTQMKSTMEIYRVGPQGGLVDRIEFPPDEDLCSSPRRDYFHSYEIRIPQRITSLGPHVLKLTVEDQLSRKTATYSLNFTVK